MKILKILGGDDYGGQYVCECQFIEFWTKQGIIVDGYIIGSGRAVENYKSILSNHYVLPDINAQFGGGLKNIFSGIKESFRYVKRNSESFLFQDNYDAIIHRGQSYLPLASYLASKHHSKAFWHLPNSLNRSLSKIYYNLTLRWLNVKPVANSLYTKKSIGSLCKHVVYPGFNEDRVITTEPSYRPKYKIDSNSKVYGTAARIHPTKAQDVLIEAFIKSRVHENGSHLLIAGISEDEDYLMKCKSLACGFENKIHFLGNVNNMPAFYSSIDIYVNSRLDAEPFGISIAEALGAGKPVIAFYVGGPSEMIKDGLNGQLVLKPSIESYQKAIKNLFDNYHIFNSKDIKESSERFGYRLNAQKFIDIVRSY